MVAAAAAKTYWKNQSAKSPPVACSSHPSEETPTQPEAKKPLGLSVPPMNLLPVLPVSYCEGEANWAG